MISVRIGSHRFHYRAAALVLHDGHILLHRLSGDNFWALPGGRVNAGEAACQTLLREFFEELDLQIECGHLVCTGENFFEYDGEPHHEIGLYFAVSLPPSCALLDKSRTHVGTEAGRKLEFSWFLTSQLQRIDMRPSVLRAALVSGTLPRHFVQEPGNAT